VQIAEFNDDGGNAAAGVLMDLPAPPTAMVCVTEAHAGRRLGDILLSVIDGADPTRFQELQRAHLVQRNTDGPAHTNAGQTNVSFREEHT